MGIRVHKFLGYGVKNLQYKKKKYSVIMLDPRVDWDKFNVRAEKAYEVEFAAFEKWCKRNSGMLLELHQREHPNRLLKPSDLNIEMFLLRPESQKKWCLADCFEHSDEYGQQRVLIIRPPRSVDWQRHDDIIDYTEEAEKYNQRTRVVSLKGPGIYPYLSGWIKFREPAILAVEKELSGWVVNGCISPGDYSQLVGLWDPKLSPVASKELLKHLKEDWRPSLPFGVIAVAAWLGCCTDLKSFLDDLRPMLYVYWR